MTVQEVDDAGYEEKGEAMTTRLVGAAIAWRGRLTREWDDERGDVPGWVLITLMTAGLVVLIWALAGPALTGVFQDAIDRVSDF